MAQTMNLTTTDKTVLNSYIPVVEGLAAYLSSCYEVVLHSLEDLNHSVICIINGEHTGRGVGAPITNKALEMLGRISQGDNDSVTYFSKNAAGEPLKSTTIAIRGESGRIIGLICINLYLKVPLEDFVGSLTNIEVAPIAPSPESFVQNTGDLIRSVYESRRAEVMADASITPSNKNKATVEALVTSGIFKIKDAVNMVADLMGISKNTVYMHIRNHKRGLQGR